MSGVHLLLAATLFETYISYDSLRSHTARSNSSFPETFGLGESRGSAFGDSRLSLASRLENKRLPPTASRVHLNLRFAVRVAMAEPRHYAFYSVTDVYSCR
jgi:hypothetical protein